MERAAQSWGDDVFVGARKHACCPGPGEYRLWFLTSRLLRDAILPILHPAIRRHSPLPQAVDIPHNKPLLALLMQRKADGIRVGHLPWLSSHILWLFTRQNHDD